MDQKKNELTLAKKQILLHDRLFQLVFSSLCVSMGLVLPSFFHLLGGAGQIFLPMHLPALLCGFFCRWRYALLCGAIMPILSSVITSMPPLFPTGFAMCFELAAYAATTSLFYHKIRLYPALILAMITGRCVSGVVNFFLLGLQGSSYGLEAFISGAFVLSLPGLILQIVLLPPLVKIIEKSLKNMGNR